MSPYKLALILLCSSALLACTTTNQEPNKAIKTSFECTAAANIQLVGNWLTVSSQKGVAGALRTLYTLNQDGSMVFVQQIKRSNKPSQGIYENGCWSVQANTVTIKTYESNGEPVNLDDPIYTSTFSLISVDQNQLRLHGPSGEVRAKRMSSGYRLPF